MSGDNNSSFGIVAFLAGAALGAGLALLFAPQSGEETRKKIKDVSGKMADDIKDNYDKLSKEAKKSVEQVKIATEKAVEHVKGFVDGARDGLKKEIKEELKQES
jgi:gas vesicle protein